MVQTNRSFTEVSATDHGNPPFKGTANVHITVTDVNDNKLRFLQSNYKSPF